MTEHRDHLGRIIKIGDFVVTVHNNNLSVGTVCRLHPKMIQYQTISDYHFWNNRKINQYPKDVVVIEGPEVSMFILKHSS